MQIEDIVYTLYMYIYIYDVNGNNKWDTSQGLVFMFVFTGMFLKASAVIFYTSCWYNYLFSQGSDGKAFVLWQ